MRIGVLAVQGDVLEHVEVARRALMSRGVSGEVVLVKHREALDTIDAVIIPGGESTVIGRLLEVRGLLEPLKKSIEGGLPVLGTCAGAVMLASRVRDRVVGETGQQILGVMSIEVLRNAFGRQRESFETTIHISKFNKSLRGVFIRAPAIVSLWGAAEALAHIDHPVLGRVAVMAVENHMIATSFHPEIAGETLVHEHLVDLALGRK